MAQVTETWPPGGADALIEGLQADHLPAIDAYDIGGLLNDPRLGRVAVVSSFGADSVALLHHVSLIRPGLPVLFLDTGKHFPETLDYARRIADRLDIELKPILPDAALLNEEDPAGDLWRDHPDGCCRIRKVLPLQDALAEFDCWISGRKRFQAATRSAVPIIERDGGTIKINPMALWSADEVDRYIAEHELERHPLVAQGYPSIGCMNCTSRVTTGAAPRSGRWAHVPEKTECGIHLGPDGKFRRG
ncbi:MAG: phosphoadenylyl-sulfate reductase [Paracoccus sp. (in: a-proteobacteria)]